MNILKLLLIGSALAWAVSIQFFVIPDLEEKEKGAKERLAFEMENAEMLLAQKIELQKTVSDLESKIESLNIAVKEISEKEPEFVIVEEEKEAVVEENHEVSNAAILQEIDTLNQRRDVERRNYENSVGQIDGYIAKGKKLLEDAEKIQPNFKEGPIRTSDADRKKWMDQKNQKINFYKSELSKLETQKESLRRGWESFSAETDLRIMQLRRGIK